MGLFYLATLFASLRFWEPPAGVPRRTWLRPRHRGRRLGMACKEVMVTVPVAILLLRSHLFLPRSFRDATLQRSWPLYVGLCWAGPAGRVELWRSRVRTRPASTCECQPTPGG